MPEHTIGTKKTLAELVDGRSELLGRRAVAAATELTSA
jgi:hypothetical protein